jgi:N6-L-threonylcarbamoyladenine synthase
LAEEKKDRYILGIETSCDETAAAVLKNGTELLSQVIASQIDTHQRYGGVVPEIASREHAVHFAPVVEEAMRRARLSFPQLSAVAVTYGPGLVGSLLVGVAGAKAIAYAAKVPLIGVHHLEGHIYANFLRRSDVAFPFLALLVSGGHTHLLLFEAHGRYHILGRTRDDAAGEAFDKISRTLGLGYPGGPGIEKAALTGKDTAFAFPRAMLEAGSLDFSFSGLKSAVLNTCNTAAMKGESLNTPDLAASFQQAVIDVLVRKSVLALKRTQAQTLLLAGGVAANQALRSQLARAMAALGVEFVCPEPALCTDNAAMIAVAGYYHYLAGDFAPWTLNAVPGLVLSQPCSV